MMGTSHTAFCRFKGGTCFRTALHTQSLVNDAYVQTSGQTSVFGILLLRCTRMYSKLFTVMIVIVFRLCCNEFIYAGERLCRRHCNQNPMLLFLRPLARRALLSWHPDVVLGTRVAEAGHL